MKSKKELAGLGKLSEDELKKEIVSSQETIYKMRFQKQVEETTDKTVINKTRKKIARIKTILRARELGLAKKEN